MYTTDTEIASSSPTSIRFDDIASRLWLTSSATHATRRLIEIAATIWRPPGVPPAEFVWDALHAFASSPDDEKRGKWRGYRARADAIAEAKALIGSDSTIASSDLVRRQAESVPAAPGRVPHPTRNLFRFFVLCAQRFGGMSYREIAEAILDSAISWTVPPLGVDDLARYQPRGGVRASRDPRVDGDHRGRIHRAWRSRTRDRADSPTTARRGPALIVGNSMPSSDYQRRTPPS